jgi:hypothetical protein
LELELLALGAWSLRDLAVHLPLRDHLLHVIANARCNRERFNLIQLFKMVPRGSVISACRPNMLGKYGNWKVANLCCRREQTLHLRHCCRSRTVAPMDKRGAALFERHGSELHWSPNWAMRVNSNWNGAKHSNHQALSSKRSVFYSYRSLNLFEIMFRIILS